MKKQLLLLPFAAMLLAGCEINAFGKTIVIGGGGNKQSEEKIDLPDNFLEEFQGYKLATKVKDGGRYLLGVYRVNENIIRFANGDYHRDSKGYYPFYLGTQEATVENAAEFEVKFVGEDEFTIQVFAPGQVWDQKYLGVYAAQSSFGNNVMSIAALDTPRQTTYTSPKDSKTYEGVVSKFKYYEECEEVKVYAPAALFQYPEEDEEAVPKFIGTGHNANVDKGEADYISMDCTSYQKATDYEAYDLAHFYEKK